MFDIYVRTALLQVAICALVPLLVCAVAGLGVAILQTATQIQEQTITYLAKLVAFGAVIALFGGVALSGLIEFLQTMLASIAPLGRLS